MKRVLPVALVAVAVIAGVAVAGGRNAPAAPGVPAAAGGRDDDAALPANARLALAKVRGTSAADRAVDAAQAVVRANTQKADGWVVLGRAWVRKARESNDPGFYLNADAAADVVLETEPEHAPALDVKGLVLLENHAFEQARALALRVVAAHPEDPMAWGTLSDALLEMGRYDEATDAVQKMVDLKPNLPSYSRVSHLQWLRGDTARAKRTIRSALDAGRDAKRDPEPGAWVLVQAATMFWNEGDVDGAEAGFEKALERIPDYVPATVGKGRVVMARGETKRAAELFARAYAVSPLVETAWLLGDARAAAGDEKGANEAYALVEREGRRSDPRTLSLFLSTRGEKTELAVSLARAELEVRKDIVTEDALAWALFRSGDLAGARAAIGRARRLGTPDPRMMFHEGAIRIAAGETAKGKALVCAALAMNPALDLASAREAKKLLEQPMAVR